MDFTLESNIVIDNGEVISFTSSVVAGTTFEGNFESGMPVVESDVTGGISGKQVELQNDGTYIQWRYVGETEWRNIVTLTTISGTDGREVEMRVSGGYIQWRLEGDSWTNLILVEDLRGPQGTAATITVGTTTTLAPGEDATVENSGDANDAIFDFGIPEGEKGDKGDAATIAVGTTTTLAPGEDATVTNSGDANDAVFDFGVPEGEKGDRGATWRGVYDGGTAYVVDDIVEYNGSSYICIVNTTGNLPTDTSKWALMAQKGIDGLGAGDMLASVYDPQAIGGDAFERGNHTGEQAISTITGLQTALDDKQKVPIDVSVATAATTAAKVGTTVGGAYVPALGDIIRVAFASGSNVSSPTLNIDGGGAKNIRLGNTNVTTAFIGTTSALSLLMWYDGTYWQIYGSLKNDNTTYSEITTAEIDAGTSSTARAITGRRMQYLRDLITTSILDAAPGTLDTLNELAAALGDDANFASTVTTALAGKQPLDSELTAIAGLTSAADKVPRFTGSGTADLLDFKDEDNMASNSASAVPSQQSVKAYVDSFINNLDIAAQGHMIIGGLQIVWGSGTANSAGTVFTMDRAFTGTPFAAFSEVFETTSAANGSFVRGISSTQITIKTSTADTRTVYWLVIGVPS